MNKANISPLPVEKYQITSGMVQNYLQNSVLGFEVGVDFTRWTGCTPDHSYVRMRVVFSAKDIVAETASADYVDRLLKNNAAGMKYKDSVIKGIKPFMYPETVGNVRNNPDEMVRLSQYGLFGEHLDEIIQHSKLAYVKDVGCFTIMLRPERIIAEMLSDPTTNESDGNLAIVKVSGTTSETIMWEVDITKSNNFTLSNGEISIDSLFTRNNVTR